jgi:hypothetical protein
MSTSRECPRCHRWHDVTTPCRMAALLDHDVQTSRDQHVADVAEEAAIEAYVRGRRQRLGDAG